MILFIHLIGKIIEKDLFDVRMAYNLLLLETGSDSYVFEYFVE
jgi:hypothetical protein